MQVEQIPINSIKLRRTRRVAEDTRPLQRSIKELGLINPITVTRDLYLIAGWHRMEACRALGWSHIPGIRMSVDDIAEELAEIDENLIRKELTTLERGEFLARRKELYEAKYPLTRAGFSQAAGMNRALNNNVSAESAPTFAKDVSIKTGIPARTIYEDLQIANSITEPLRDVIRDTPIADKKTELLTLARMEPEAQTQIAQIIIHAPKAPETVREIIEPKPPVLKLVPQSGPTEEMRLTNRQEAIKAACNKLIAVRQSLETMPDAEVILTSITELVAELKEFGNTTEAQWRQRVIKAIGENQCNTFEDITDELNFSSRLRFPVSKVKQIVAELIREGRVYTVQRAVAGRNKLMGTYIYLAEETTQAA